MLTRIVAFSPTSYPTFTSLWNEAYPELKRTEFEMRLFDMSLPHQTSGRRWLAEHDGQLVGFSGYEPVEGDSPSEGKLQLHLYVTKAHRTKGIGSRLYEKVTAALTDGRDVRAWVRQDRAESLHFMAARGFVEQMRTFHSALEVAAFDLSSLEKYLRRLQKYEYRFRTFVDLATEPERNRKIHELYCTVLRDIPSPDPRQIMSFADYEKRISMSPELFGAYFIALHRDEYVGLCVLFPQGRATRELYADTMGVRREYRGRGIAQALSHCGIQYARRRGYSTIWADSFVENHRINVLLESLGFGARTEWTLFSKGRTSLKKL